MNGSTPCKNIVRSNINGCTLLGKKGVLALCRDTGRSHRNGRALSGKEGVLAQARIQVEVTRMAEHFQANKDLMLRQ
jgi:hypothetical protein